MFKGPLIHITYNNQQTSKHTHTYNHIVGVDIVWVRNIWYWTELHSCVINYCRQKRNGWSQQNSLNLAARLTHRQGCYGICSLAGHHHWQWLDNPQNGIRYTSERGKERGREREGWKEREDMKLNEKQRRRKASHAHISLVGNFELVRTFCRDFSEPQSIK